MTTPAISVIVPAYNVEKYLAGCLESVLNQTFQDFEIIVVDDGSPDSSGQIADSYAKKDKRIRVVHQENKGLSGARNSALEVMQGKTVFFLDSDDYLHPQALEALFTAMQQTKAPIVACDLQTTKEVYHNIEPNYDLSQIPVKKYDNPLEVFVKSKKILSNAFKLYAKEVIKDIRFIEGVYFEDVPFTLMALSKVDSIALIPWKMLYYFTSSVSIMRSNFGMKKVESYIRIIREMDAYIQKNYPDKRGAVRKGVLNKRFKMMLSQCMRKQKDKAELYHLFEKIAVETKQLFQENIINFSGLKFQYKVALWLLLHTKTGKEACLWLRYFPL